MKQTAIACRARLPAAQQSEQRHKPAETKNSKTKIGEIPAEFIAKKANNGQVK
jgi:hypothetical protein